jgi:hypothetical protein
LGVEIEGYTRKIEEGKLEEERKKGESERREKQEDRKMEDRKIEKEKWMRLKEGGDWKRGETQEGNTFGVIN